MEEDSTVEFKEKLDEEKAIRTMIAFANHKGGKIYIGIRDDGKVQGADIGKNKLELFTRKVHDETEPAIIFDTKFEEIEGKKVLVIEVKEAKRKPSFYNGVAYKRVNKTTLRVTDPEEIRSIFIHKTIFFDDIVCEDATIEDIDPQSIEKFLMKASGAGRISTGKMSTEEVLKKLDLVKGNKLKNAALMLFGKRPSSFFHTWGIKCAVMTEGYDFIAMEDYNENLMMSIDKAIEFVDQHVKKDIRIIGVRRTETPHIPLEVVREAVVNAVAHRDYFFPSFAYVAMFSNRIEIKNPGKLEGLTIEELSKAHPSVIKNPLVANALHLAGYIEKWGSGTLKMINLMRENSLKDPEFVSDSMFFVRLKDEKTALNEREGFIIQALQETEKLKAGEIAKKFNVSLTTAAKDFAHLMELGFVKKTGQRKASYYSIVGSN